MCRSASVVRCLIVPFLAVNLATSQARQVSSLPSPLNAHKVDSVHITILSTMLAESGIREWSFAALVEVDGRRLLFDTGDRPETVLQNARELGIDLSNVIDVVLSHHHADHTGGLVTLRREFGRTNPTALSRIHVGPGAFLSRRRVGGVFIVHNAPTELLPGVWLTGPVPRRNAEQNWPPTAAS